MFTSYELVNAAFKDEETFPSAAFYSNVRGFAAVQPGPR
jgi:hypothetical protein